jgi:hypothetical protein
VIGAHIIKPDGTGTYSGKDGLFEVKVDRLPARIRIRHISYGESVIESRDPLPDLLVIRIKQQVSEIGEVQITARRMRILTEKEDFNLQDFAFDDRNLWMIGYLDNQFNKGRLWVATWFGDTIRSIPIRGAEKLRRDFFGNVQLFCGDSVFQLFDNGDSIILAYTYGKDEFEASVAPFHLAFNYNLVYSRLSEMGFARDLYFLRYNDRESRWLTSIEDALGRRDYRLWLRVGGTPPLNLTIRAPMFSLNDSLFVVNVIKDSLLVYDPKGCFSGSRPFDFHKTIVLGVPEYINFDFLTDPVGSAVYVVDHRNFNYRIARLDPATGRTGQPVPLPDLPGMSRITTYAGAIYFLYQEKKFPYYTRLYRYQL